MVCTIIYAHGQWVYKTAIFVCVLNTALEIIGSALADVKCIGARPLLPECCLAAQIYYRRPPSRPNFVATHALRAIILEPYNSRMKFFFDDDTFLSLFLYFIDSACL